MAFYVVHFSHVQGAEGLQEMEEEFVKQYQI